MAILDRMDAALARLAERNRAPKAFYLGPSDWAEFEAAADLTATVTLPWGNNPVQMRTDPAFKDVPVRQSKSTTTDGSNLYDLYGYGHPLAIVPGREPRPMPANRTADQVAAALDALSRTRALTDGESIALEQALKGRVSRREAIRLGIA